jgi:hypothetical protein
MFSLDSPLFSGLYVNSGLLVKPDVVTLPIRTVNRVDASQRSDEALRRAKTRDRVTLSGDEAESNTDVSVGDTELDEKQKAELSELQSRDRNVRAHEAAHQAAGGSAAGPASFTYKLGPDKRQYAVGGEVPIRLESGRTPEETIAKARQVRAAALAPADPSAQDMAVAASATQMEIAAQMQKARAAADAYQRSGGKSKASSLSSTGNLAAHISGA